MKEHTTIIIVNFFEKEIICKFGVPKYVLIDNGGEWMVGFNMFCKFFGITHQFTTPQWPYCNNMLERMIKILKHGLTT
jgi:hypothetical protein